MATRARRSSVRHGDDDGDGGSPMAQSPAAAARCEPLQPSRPAPEPPPGALGTARTRKCSLRPAARRAAPLPAPARSPVPQRRAPPDARGAVRQRELGGRRLRRLVRLGRRGGHGRGPARHALRPQASAGAGAASVGVPGPAGRDAEAGHQWRLGDRCAPPRRALAAPRSRYHRGACSQATLGRRKAASQPRKGRQPQRRRRRRRRRTTTTTSPCGCRRPRGSPLGRRRGSSCRPRSTAASTTTGSTRHRWTLPSQATATAGATRASSTPAGCSGVPPAACACLPWAR